MGNRSEFTKAVALVLAAVPNFDLNSTVQLFESNIRVLGGLLSAHAIATNPVFGMGTPEHFFDPYLSYPSSFLILICWSNCLFVLTLTRG